MQQAESALSELSQSSSLQTALEPIITSVVQNNLLQHKDKDVRLLVAACLTEIIRVLAPDPPFNDEIFKVKNPSANGPAANNLYCFLHFAFMCKVSI